MFNWIISFYYWITGKERARDLSEYLTETRKVTVNGIRFTVRRLNIYDYLDGSKTLTTYYQLYQAGKVKEAEQSLKKVTDHYKDCFMSAVVKPKLKRKDDPEDAAIFVDEITRDLSLAQKLYIEIISFTDNKKKAF